MTHTHIPSLSPSRPVTRWLGLAALVVVFLLLAGCQQTGQMVQQPRYNPLVASTLFPNGQSAQVPVSGSVPYMATGSPNDPALTGQDANGQPVKGWANVKVDQNLVQLGQDRYNIYCIPCHGPNGEGNGKVTGFGFPKPPNLQQSNLSNGDIFNIITNGRGKMFSYGYRVKPNERWAVIAYVRALQIAKGPVDAKSLTPAQINQIGSQQ